MSIITSPHALAAVALSRRCFVSRFFPVSEARRSQSDIVCRFVARTQPPDTSSTSRCYSDSARAASRGCETFGADIKQQLTLLTLITTGRLQSVESESRCIR